MHVERQATAMEGNGVFKIQKRKGLKVTIKK